MASRSCCAAMLGALLLISVRRAAGLECDWSPKPNSPPNTNPVSIAAGGVGVHVRDVKSPGGGTASLWSAGEGDDAMHVLHLAGPSAYEVGRAYGMALASEIQTMMAAELQHFAAIVAGGHMDTTNSTLELIRRLGFDGALDYVANATRPYTPADILDELAGIAHGSGVDEQLLLRVHMFPELMQASCSLIFSHGAARAAVDGSLLAVRALDWDVSGVLQNFPLLLVYHRDPSTAGEEPRVFATLGWAGFVGGITGLNSQGLVIGEIGVGYPDDSFGPDNRDGEPWMFLSRDVAKHDSTVADAVKRLSSTKRTTHLLVALGAQSPVTADSAVVGLKYTTDDLVQFTPDTLLPQESWHPRFTDVIWWSMDWLCATFDEVMADFIGPLHASANLTAEAFMHTGLPTVNTGNLHVAIVDASVGDAGALYVANARAEGESGPDNAYERAYVQFDLRKLFTLSPTQ